MKIGQHQLPSDPDASQSEFASQPVDRRRFLQYAAGVGAMVSLGASAFGQATPDAANAAGGLAAARLPDGSEHVSWEQPLTFSKTYSVDNGSPRASDTGPGTRERPFRTINKAAQVLQPGERVVIASGTYRECVRPARGGMGPTQMISYEAAPGAKVFIKGSEVLKDGWTRDPANAFRRPGGANGNPTAPPPPHGGISSLARCFRMPTIRLRWRAWRATVHGWTPRQSTWGRTSGGGDWYLLMASRWSRWSSSAN
jgi:hypothetical protein